MECVGKAVGQLVGLLDLVAQFGEVGVAMLDCFELRNIAVAYLDKFGLCLDAVLATERLVRVVTLADFGQTLGVGVDALGIGLNRRVYIFEFDGYRLKSLGKHLGRSIR